MPTYALLYNCFTAALLRLYFGFTSALPRFTTDLLLGMGLKQVGADFTAETGGQIVWSLLLLYYCFTTYYCFTAALLQGLIQVGDIIAEIGGQSVRGLPFDRVVAILGAL